MTSKALTRLIQPPGRIESGESYFYPEPGKRIDVMALSEEEVRRLRGNLIAYVYQDPNAALDPLYTVGYQIAETMKVHGKVKSIKEGVKKAVEVLAQVFMPDSEARVKAYPHELSGGMKQRSVIGMEISNKPKLLIADEPTTALDVSVQAQILNLLKDLQRERALTYLFISHDLEVVRYMSDYIAVMYLGKIAEFGPAEEVFEKPMHPYTEALLSSIPIPDPKLAKKVKRIILKGEPPSPLNPPSGCRFRTRCPLAFDKCLEEPPLEEA